MTALLAALVLFFFAFPCSAVDPGAPLKGGVSLSEQLPSVPASMAPGADYSPDAVGKHYKAVEDWRRIPSWKVGSFHIETEIQYTPRGPKEVLSRLDTSGGHMQDSKGHYWQRYNVPEPGAPVESETSLQFSNIVSDEAIEIGPKKVVSRVRGISFIVDKRTKKIIRVAQQEILQSEVPVGPGRYRTDCQRRVFGANGKYLTDITSTTFADRIGPFEPVPQLQESFRRYLMSQGRPDLIPQ
jgi:hypothetical protein